KLYAFAFSAAGPGFVGCDTGGFRSEDDGGSLAAHNVGLSNLLVYSLVFNSAGALFSGTGGGVFRSNSNGDNWTGKTGGFFCVVEWIARSRRASRLTSEQAV